ncbi:PilT/PilU family type 4a pilus ATPase [Thalassolituus sp. LLYu03]|uniref:PilT/PilU family type 4a pilus ATPase n=1 Tax=Thalassolituus sp. LLYu03 TaxID=3421656 RepID=UPI003D2E919B
MDLTAYLTLLAKHGGSDLYLSTGAPPCAKFNGVLKNLRPEPLKPGEVEQMARAVMDAQQQKSLEHDLELNMALSMSGIGRFRLNAFYQRNQISLVVRNIRMTVPKFEELRLPPVLKDCIMAKRGLILVVGATGSGKSTTLAALIDYRNANAAGHIITIEDPVEFVHRHQKSVVNQREVGVDTRSFHDALKNTLRQAPDVIQIGEIRDQETMEHVLNYAETGHLVVSTLHANNANQAVDRILNFFPETRHPQILQDLGNNLLAIVSQRLVPDKSGGRVPALEILLGSPRVKDLIQNGKLEELKEAMEKSNNTGMQSFDQALLQLVKEGQIESEVALRNADSANNLRVAMKVGGQSSAGGLEGVTLADM